MTQGNYYVTFRGEDGSIFTREYNGSPEHILDEAAEDYPEATVLEWFKPEDREREIYARAQAMFDDPDLDDYDY